MLTKRTNILFDEDIWSKLVKIARARNISTSMVIREAVEDKLSEEEILAKRREAVESTLHHRLKSKDKIDYKELINYGRKF